MPRHIHATVVMTALMAAVSFAWAQGAPAAPTTTVAQPEKPATGGTPGQPAPEAYTYNPDGRRDPFVSLLARGMEAAPGSKSLGLGGMATSELILRGVLQSRGTYVAIVSGPDGKTYRAHVNDRLLDGIIRSVTPQGMVIMQEVNDPLSLVKQREVRKGLRTAEDGK